MQNRTPRTICALARRRSCFRGMSMVLIVLSIACGSQTTRPSSGGTTVAGQPGSSANTSNFMLRITAGGPFTATFQGQIITAPGDYTFSKLTSGTYVVAGQMQPGNTNMSFNLVRNGPFGGVVPGSIQSLQGTTGQVGNCFVMFNSPNGGTQDVQFQFRIDVTIDQSTAC